VPDDVEQFRGTVRAELASADLLITSGGVSAGAYEVVKDAFRELGTVEFVKVPMQPGGPQGAGTVDGVPVVTLPGNPVSAFVSFEVFVRPALRRALGYTSPDRLHVPARLTGALRSPAGRRQFLRGRYEGGQVSQVGGPGSHLVAHLARANCLVVVPEGVTELPAGADVDVVLIEGALQ
jgi:molybdopterin molybdotransferase